VLTQAQIASLMSGAMYVDVGTHANPAGEIRGQITRAAAVSTGATTGVGAGTGGGGHVSHSSHSSHTSHYSGG
jgi:CHRD domain